MSGQKKRVCIIRDVEINCTKDCRQSYPDLELVPEVQNVLPEKRRNSVKLAIDVTWNQLAKVYNFNIGIKSSLFREINFTDDCIFYIRACVGPKPPDDKWSSPLTETILSVTDKLTVTKPVKFDVAFKQFGLQRAPSQNESFRIVVEVIPFVIPRVPANHWLLFLMFNSFSELVVPIDRYCDDWPFISWIRQNQTTKDASVPELYDRLFSKCRDFDFDDFKDGLAFERTRRPFSIDRSTALEMAIHNPERFASDVNASGMTPTKFFNFAQRLTRAFAEESGYTYQVFASTPKHRLHIADKTDLIAYVPAFDREGYIVSDFVGNTNVVYRLYALIREEEGQYTATYYSPKTRKFYDVRNNTITPLDRTPPPMCNSREQYVFLLYVHNDLDFYMTPFSPIMPFLKKQMTVDLYEYTGSAVQLRGSSEVSTLDRDYWYFSYDPVTNPHPTYPLDSICGKSVLRIANTDTAGEKVLVWTLSGEPVLTPISDIRESVNSCEHRFVCIRKNHGIVAICDGTSPFPTPLFRVPVKQLSPKPNANLFAVHFTKPQDGVLEHRKDSLLVLMDDSDDSYNALLGYLGDLAPYTLLAKANGEKLLRIPNSEAFRGFYPKFNKSQQFMELFVNELD